MSESSVSARGRNAFAMPKPLVSVIVPAYNGEDLVAEAVRSVLAQTYESLELIVVDDGSTDATAAVLARFTDPRVRYVAHDRNRGPDAARLTGVRASAGDIIAFLDQDDLFHRDKLAAHVQFLEAEPAVGLSYNPHFVLSDPSRRILGVWRPPAAITLDDLILGFPIPPSAWVLRRHWALRDEIWDERTMFRGREVVFCGRLFAAGCQFGLVNRVLHYRRTRAGRHFTNPADKCRDERRCQEIMLDDRRCPPTTRALRPVAAANACLVWANAALAQRDTAQGQALLREALGLQPALADGAPSPLVEFFVAHAVLDSDDPERQLRTVFSQLPDDCVATGAQLEWAVRQAVLMTGAQHVVWGRPEDGQGHFRRARQLGVRIDEAFAGRVTHDLLGCELALGRDAAREAVHRLATTLAAIDGPAAARRLRSTYWLASAFEHHVAGHARQVPARVLRAFAADPRHMRNRGAWSILARSLGAASRRNAATSRG